MPKIKDFNSLQLIPAITGVSSIAQTRFIKTYGEKILKYYENWRLYHEMPVTKTSASGETTETMERIAGELPTKKNLAGELNIKYTELLLHLEKSPTLRTLINTLESNLLKDSLIQGGLLNLYPSTFCIFLLKTIYGLSDSPKSLKLAGDDISNIASSPYDVISARKRKVKKNKVVMEAKIEPLREYQ